MEGVRAVSLIPNIIYAGLVNIIFTILKSTYSDLTWTTVLDFT